MGNAPGTGDIAAAVDGADKVVRFNNARGFGGETGTAVDELYLINSGGQMREWLADAVFLARPVVAATRCITLPIAPETGALFPPSNEPEGEDSRNFAPEACARFRAAGKAVRVLPASRYRAACEALGLLPLKPGSRTPSTGFLAIYAAFGALPADATLALYGFGFDGWEGHPFDREREFVERHSGDRLVWHSLPGTAQARA
ncbi:hypothetical protein RDV64_09200 [Acuticoccus sp. MNP-M23]|uniref:hypothetical protein n=1 Tax=Acuticoccus sp. MNP-M23 TaxID=3072793 RepID=UPI0028150EDC|nr:hypothetical protein [Acuticoccus sp. MNP-M23]WMS44541.1 hypothetical protein RDV64_09200 [Acuticoccus sp. MNP-M23]